MIFAQRSRQAGAAFVNGATGDRESGDAIARTVRGLFGQVSGDDGGIHIFNFLGLVFKAGMILNCRAGIRRVTADLLRL
jgi:hypothetical protein